MSNSQTIQENNARLDAIVELLKTKSAGGSIDLTEIEEAIAALFEETTSIREHINTRTQNVYFADNGYNANPDMEYEDNDTVLWASGVVLQPGDYLINHHLYKYQVDTVTPTETGYTFTYHFVESLVPDLYLETANLWNRYTTLSNSNSALASAQETLTANQTELNERVTMLENASGSAGGASLKSEELPRSGMYNRIKELYLSGKLLKLEVYLKSAMQTNRYRWVMKSTGNTAETTTHTPWNQGESYTFYPMGHLENTSGVAYVNFAGMGRSSANPIQHLQVTNSNVANAVIYDIMATSAQAILGTMNISNIYTGTNFILTVYYFE